MKFYFIFQDNRLDYLPEGLFSLPALVHLDVSNNKLASLPYKMWFAPKLRDLNLSLNLLETLPDKPDSQQHQLDSCSILELSTDDDADSSLGLSDASSSTSTPRSTPRNFPKPLSGTYTSTVSSLGLGGDSVVVGCGDGEEEVVGRRGHESRSGLTLDKHGNVITCLRQRELKHHSLWTQAVQVILTA